MKVSYKERKGWNYSKLEIRKFPFVYAIIAIPVIQIILFFFYVNLSSFALSFTNSEGEWSLESYERVIKALVSGEDHLGFNLQTLIGNSMIIWIVNHVIGFAISILTSFILTKHMVGSKIFRIIYHIPGIVGGVVFIGVMKEMFSSSGVVVNLLESFGVDLPINIRKYGLLGYKPTAFWCIMAEQLIRSMAGGNMIMAGAYMRIPDEIFESAQLEGCGIVREAFQIAMPCIWPTLSTMTIFALCGFFTADCGMYIYSDGTGKFGMTSVGYYLYRFNVALTQVSSGSHIYGYISAFGLFMTLITLPIVFIGRKLLSRFQENVEF